MKTVSTDRAPAAIGPYSQAKITGGLVFASGQIREHRNSDLRGTRRGVATNSHRKLRLFFLCKRGRHGRCDTV